LPVWPVERPIFFGQIRPSLSLASINQLLAAAPNPSLAHWLGATSANRVHSAAHFL
jgi:hypothetical protein